MDECFGTFDGNTVQTISHDFLPASDPAVGWPKLQNNLLNGGGLQVNDPNAGSGPIAVSNNTFNGTFGNTYTNMLRLKNNYTGLATTVSGNTFTNTNWAAALENYPTVSVTNNTFTPVAGSTTYRHLTVNTKEIGSSSGFYPPVVGLTLQSNTFNGSGTPGGTGVAFYNRTARDLLTYGTFSVGGAGALANNFSNWCRHFRATRWTTATRLRGTGTSRLPGIHRYPPTNMACWTPNIDIDENLFDVGSGLQTRAA